MNAVRNCILLYENIYLKKKRIAVEMIATAFTHIACDFVGQTFVIRCHDLNLTLFMQCNGSGSLSHGKYGVDMCTGSFGIMNSKYLSN